MKTLVLPQCMDQNNNKKKSLKTTSDHIKVQCGAQLLHVSLKPEGSTANWASNTKNSW